MRRLVALLALVVVSPAWGAISPAAATWPDGPPTGYFSLSGRGQPALTCADWKSKLPGYDVVNCPLAGTKLLTWPPPNARPVNGWKALDHGVRVVCVQYGATRNGKYAGLVARCSPA